MYFLLLLNFGILSFFQLYHRLYIWSRSMFFLVLMWMPSIEFLIEQFGRVGVWHITRRKRRLWGRLFTPNVASGFGKLFSILKWLGSWTEWLILSLSSSGFLLVSIHWAVLVKHGGSEVKNLLLVTPRCLVLECISNF